MYFDKTDSLKMRQGEQNDGLWTEVVTTARKGIMPVFVLKSTSVNRIPV